MQIYNTFKNKKEDLIPLNEGHYKIYVCGPTVYNLIHIGNARPLCVFDTLKRYLEFMGNKVTYVQNFTDIDDKIIRKSNVENVSIDEISTRYIKEYEKDAEGLNLSKNIIQPKATETIDEIVGIISKLIEKGHAYKASNGDVYFSSRSFDNYGMLSNMVLDDLEEGHRIDVDENKKDVLDFVLWKASKDNEPYWESPFSKGRPGWHIECTAMIKKYLGDTIDIHCGGQDLIFPHHENEIAQGECLSGTKYVNYWMHNGYINVDSKKMSKSLNNFFTTRDVAEKYGYEPIRYLMISSHYRSPINYSLDSIEQSVNSLNRIYNFKENLLFHLDNLEDGKDISLIELVDKAKLKFIESMEDDLNTAEALSHIFNFIKEYNVKSKNGVSFSHKSLKYSMDTLKDLFSVLGIINKDEANINNEIKTLIDEREQARQNKDYEKADEIRDILKGMGVVLKDTKNGVIFSRE